MILNFIVATIGVRRRNMQAYPMACFWTKSSTRLGFLWPVKDLTIRDQPSQWRCFKHWDWNPKLKTKKEKESNKKKAAAEAVVPSTKRSKTKASDEGKKKKKLKRERNPSSILKKRLLMMSYLPLLQILLTWLILPLLLLLHQSLLQKG